jgi:hypothetical protein
VARPERFELPTTKFVAWYSIQLSYGRTELLIMRMEGVVVNAWEEIGLGCRGPVHGRLTVALFCLLYREGGRRLTSWTVENFFNRKMVTDER